MKNIIDECYKVAHIASSVNGGAGIATKRLSKALNSVNVDNQIFVKDAVDTTANIEGLQISTIENLPKSKIEPNPKLETETITDKYINLLGRKNIYKGNTFFTHISKSLSNSVLERLVANFDVINIHWISGFLSVENIAYLSWLDTPLVWTAHDKYPLSGGCHVFQGCEKWKTNCMQCPQLINTFSDFPAHILATKNAKINFKNITLVALNNNYKAMAQQSPLFKYSRIEVIKNSVDIDLFKPQKISIYKKLQKKIKSKIVLLYVIAYTSTIKGFNEFCQTTHLLQNKSQYHILLVGNLPSERNLAVSYTDCGYVNHTNLIELYNLADMTVVPSLEETGPLCCLESLACGTPVVGFSVGGVPDMITDGKNGFIIPVGDICGFAEAIQKIAQLKNNPSQSNEISLKNLSENCRNYAEQELSLHTQGLQYKELYTDLLKEKNSFKKPLKKKLTIPDTIFLELQKSYQLQLEEIKVLKIKRLQVLEDELNAIKNSDSFRFMNGSLIIKCKIVLKVLAKKMGNILKTILNK